MSKEMREQIDNFKNFLLKENKKVSVENFNQALEDISPLIPQLSHKLIHINGLEHNEENIVKLNKELKDKVKNGDDEVLDELWELAWSGIMKNAINVITHYTKK